MHIFPICKVSITWVTPTFFQHLEPYLGPCNPLASESQGNWVRETLHWTTMGTVGHTSALFSWGRLSKKIIKLKSVWFLRYPQKHFRIFFTFENWVIWGFYTMYSDQFHSPPKLLPEPYSPNIPPEFMPPPSFLF